MRPSVLPSASGEEFPFGWRFVKRVRPDGSETLDRVPLTLEDVLYPQENDFIPGNIPHDDDCVYLKIVFRSRQLSPGFTFVSHDLLVNWGVAGIGNHAPDVGVFVGLREVPRTGGLLDVRGLGGRCVVVVEVVSLSTRVNDVVHKMDHYFRVGIPYYILIDQVVEDGPRTLHVYRRSLNGYEEIPHDVQGRVLLPPLGLFIAVRDDRAVCFDAVTGEELGDYSELCRAREQDRDEFRLYKEEVEKDFTEQADTLAKQSAALQLAEAEAKNQREQTDKQRQEADKLRQEKKEVERQKQLAQDEAAKVILELQEKLRMLQASTNPPA